MSVLLLLSFAVCFALLFLCSCVVLVLLLFFSLFFFSLLLLLLPLLPLLAVGLVVGIISSLSFRYLVSLSFFSSLLFYYLLLLLLALCTQRFARYMAMLRSFPEHEPVMLRLDDFVKRTNEYLRSNDLPSGGQLEHLLTRCGDVCSFLFRCFSCCSSLHLLP